MVYWVCRPNLSNVPWGFTTVTLIRTVLCTAVRCTTLQKDSKERGWATLGKISAVLFAIFCIGGSFGGGNAAQSNQATIVIKELMGLESTGAGFWIGVVIAFFVGIVIIGGIKRIASVTEKVVPFMALMYILCCLYIIITNFSLVDDAFGLILTEAFNPQAVGVRGCHWGIVGRFPSSSLFKRGRGWFGIHCSLSGSYEIFSQ